MIFAWLFFMLCLWAVFTLFLLAPYYLVSHSKLKVLVRTWIIAFWWEISLIMLVPKVTIPVLDMHMEGYMYLMVFTIGINEVGHGILYDHRFDYLLLLVIPLIIALIAYWRNRQVKD